MAFEIYWLCWLLFINCAFSKRCGFTAVVYLPYKTDVYFDLRLIGPAIDIAIETVKNSTLQECDINLITAKTNGQSGDCDNVAANAARTISKYYYQWLDTPQPMALALGAGCSYGTKEIVDLATPLNFMVMDGAGVGMFLNDKVRYPTLIRWSYTQYKASQLVVQMMRKFQWNNIVMLYNDESAVYRVLKSIVDAIKLNQDIHVDYLPYYTIKRGMVDALRVVTEAHKMTRVVLIAGYATEIRAMMRKAYQEGYTGGDHIYFAIAYFKTKNYYRIPEWKMGDDFDEGAKVAYQSLFLLKQSIPDTAAFHTFEKRVEEMAVRDYNESIEPYDDVNTHDLGFHDSVIAYGQVINETLQRGEDMFDAATVAKKFRNRTFYGMRGRMTLDSNNDLNGNYEIWNFEIASLSWVKIFDFSEEAKFITQVAPISWVLGQPPPNEPFCGYTGHNPLCIPVNYTKYYAGGITAAVILLFALSMGAVMLNLKRKQDKKDLHWWEVHSYELSRMRWTNSKANLAGSIDGSNMDDLKDPFGHSAVNTAIYHGIRVYIITNEKMVMNVHAKTELKKLRHTKCDKLVGIIGVCLSDDLRCLVFEYCPRGDIYDLVQNADTYTFIVDWNLRFSLIRDIAEALQFIHRSWIRCHGKLRSTKCLMDQRFVVKITDYSLRDLRPEVLPEDVEIRKQAWVAPELVRRQETLSSIPAEDIRRADIYSLGIIMSEVIWMRDPEKPPEQDNHERIFEFLTHAIGAQPRALPDNAQTYGSARLVAQCLLGDPFRRPDIVFIHKTLKAIAGNKAAGAADNLIARMAAYAEELEIIVNQRTSAIQDEQKKVEDLLFEILPKSIAQSMMAGMMSDPEEFEHVTVLFSCVEDFGSIAASHDPFELVVILNELYNLIDNIIANFDAYKVETITDTYMVVSGLPIRNRIRHVAEIAYFALSLMEHSKTFVIKSMPTLKIELKIGIHTGNCMAGCIGKRMPRYCLFGDTINTASRMETSSEGGKIQVSEASRNFLQKQKDRACFVLTARGTVFVKGKGDMNTFWLTASPEQKHITQSV